MTKLKDFFKRQIEYSHSKNRNDEYYTKIEEVEEIFEKVIGYDFLKDKIIYCPCDGEQSEFVKYLKEKKDEINYKDFWYTSDDFNTHIDLIQKADLVITNPPFSKVIREYYPLMKKYAKNYFFFHSTTSMYKYNDNDVFIYRANRFNFNTQFFSQFTCMKEAYVNHIYVSNFKCNQPCKHKFPIRTYDELYKDKEPVHAEISDGTRILSIDKNADIPIDYDKPMLVPITILYDYFKQHFDVTELQGKIIKFSDEKSRYIRFLVKWKNIK